MIKCKFCESENLTEIYKIDNLPLFQNKVYETQYDAQVQKTGMLVLKKCLDCGFVYNDSFDSSLMAYDKNYQNEQGYSSEFLTHLHSIVIFLEEQGFKKKKIIEIGCGKGFFLELLKKNGFVDVIGFDPAYEGDNPDIVKDYFGEKYKSLNADVIIIRHVLEHIERPYIFLKMLRDLASSNTQVFIEVPDFNWITNKAAFWDIYYEHCNYFELEFITSLFSDSIVTSAFSGQYMYLLAKLKNLKIPVLHKQSFSLLFESNLQSIKKFFLSNKPLVLWGGSSKGVTLLNLLDPKRELVEFVIDINPVKHNKYIAITGHKILSPDFLLHIKSEVNVLVVNENYFDEIVNSYQNMAKINFYSLEKLNNE